MNEACHCRGSKGSKDALRRSFLGVRKALSTLRGVHWKPPPEPACIAILEYVVAGYCSHSVRRVWTLVRAMVSYTSLDSTAGVFISMSRLNMYVFVWSPILAADWPSAE